MSDFQGGQEQRPKHEEIALVAFRHWEDRKDFGILGDALSDWFWAENLLRRTHQ